MPATTPVSEGDRKAIVAARVLWIYREDLAWQLVWPLMLADQAFGREVAAAVEWYVSGHHLQFGERLTNEQVADLYLWLERQFPHSEYNISGDIHWVTERERIALWRDSLLRVLSLRGTFAAYDAIVRIALELPDLDRVSGALLKAHDLARRNTWRPPSADDILNLAANNDARLVRNAEQLLEAVVESLGRLQMRLQRQETPLARFLWDKVPVAPKDPMRKVFRPVEENTLSDYLKVHLQDDLRDRGIILGREVEIRKGYLAPKQTGRRPGQRTDIHINVSVPQPDGPGAQTLTAVAEVKGIWNDGLWSSMRSQLVDRYLEHNGHTHGLYVVGWFNQEAWDPDDPNRDRNRQQTLQESQDLLDKQAMELSKGGTCVKALVLDISLG